jgi:GTP-dependent dephospho-CoA kinase
LDLDAGHRQGIRCSAIEPTDSLVLTAFRRAWESIQLRVTESDLLRLKLPLGTLIHGSPAETMPKLARLVQTVRPPMIVAVGDVVSRETVVAKIPVNLRIVDMKTLRKSTVSTAYAARRSFRTSNPAGVISMGAWDIIKEALKTGDALVVVEGEEDLLALPCVLESPDNSFVLYGQPNEGLVVVESSKEKKSEVKAILDNMVREEIPI